MTMESKEPKREKKNLKLKKEKESKDKLCAIAIMLKWLNLQITKKKNNKGEWVTHQFLHVYYYSFFSPTTDLKVV